MKSHKMMLFIHKYGMFYSVFLYMAVVLNAGIYPNNIDFWMILFCFCLSVYFIFHKGMVYAISKQFEYEEFKKELINSVANKNIHDLANKLYEEMNEEDEDEDSKLN